MTYREQVKPGWSSRPALSIRYTVSEKGPEIKDQSQMRAGFDEARNTTFETKAKASVVLHHATMRLASGEGDQKSKWQKVFAKEPHE